MPPAALVDLSRFDLDSLQFDPEAVRACNPHRHELELLHGVIAFLPEENLIVGVHDAKEDAFWVRGHVPGRPLFPGVLMVETAAQLCSFYWHQAFPGLDRFFGFVGIESTRFRGAVVPGDRLILVARSIQMRPRRATFDAQGFLGDTMVFETRIKGMLV